MLALQLYMYIVHKYNYTGGAGTISFFTGWVYTIRMIWKPFWSSVILLVREMHVSKLDGDSEWLRCLLRCGVAKKLAARF